jgi:hypothetical protein
MFANCPPLGLFQVQTLGGVYSGELLMSTGSSLQKFSRNRRRAQAWRTVSNHLGFVSAAA